MAVKEARANIVLACNECKQRNYNTKKNKKNNPERIELSKYCRFCKKHTAHRETSVRDMADEKASARWIRTRNRAFPPARPVSSSALPGLIVQPFKNTWRELKKVTWPTRKDSGQLHHDRAGLHGLHGRCDWPAGHGFIRPGVIACQLGWMRQRLKDHA